LSARRGDLAHAHAALRRTLVGVVILVGATYVPALALGPIVEHLIMIQQSEVWRLWLAPQRSPALRPGDRVQATIDSFLPRRQCATR
jgi:hypothetical protein